MSYFETKLWELLRGIDREEARKQAVALGLPDGDLQVFLRILASTLDDLKDLTDRLPNLVDPDTCPAPLLSYLGALVGFEPPAGLSETRVRKLLKLAVETYRRNGTFPSLAFDLRVAGLEGETEETFHQALRLNRRAKLNTAKLPGRVYGLGVYRVATSSPLPEVKAVARQSHPAGRKLFLMQRFRDHLDEGVNVSVKANATVRRSLIAYAGDGLRLNRHALNGPNVLTTHRTNWIAAGARFTTQVTPNPESRSVATIATGLLATLPPPWAGNRLTIVQFP